MDQPMDPGKYKELRSKYHNKNMIDKIKNNWKSSSVDLESYPGDDEKDNNEEIAKLEEEYRDYRIVQKEQEEKAEAAAPDETAKAHVDDALFQRYNNFEKVDPLKTRPCEVVIRVTKEASRAINILQKKFNCSFSADGILMDDRLNNPLDYQSLPPKLQNPIRSLVNINTYEKLSEESLGRMYVPEVMRSDLEIKYKCCSVKLPEPKSHFVYASKNWHFKQRLIVFYPSTPGIPGFWNRDWVLTKKESINKATQISFIHAACKRDYGCLILIPYFNFTSKKEPLEGSETPMNHVKTFWSRICKYARGKVCVIGHEKGCDLALVHACQEAETFRQKVDTVMLIDPEFENELVPSEEFGNFLQNIQLQAWSRSKEPLNTSLNDIELKVGENAPVFNNYFWKLKAVSAATELSWDVPASIQESMFDFMETKKAGNLYMNDELGVKAVQSKSKSSLVSAQESTINEDVNTQQNNNNN